MAWSGPCERRRGRPVGAERRLGSPTEPSLTAAPAPIISLAYRGDGSDRPTAVPVPISAARAMRGSRIRKYWRYVGIWGPTMSICAARVLVGPFIQEFWAIWQRDGGRLYERTRMSGGRVEAGADRLRVRDAGVVIDVDLYVVEHSAVEVVTPVGRDWTWTRKVAARAIGTVLVDGQRLDLDAPALVDDNGGYHPRRTHWWWSAGAGTLTDGRQAMWNAVVGLNDTPPHTENTVWIDGRPLPIGPVQISQNLTGTTFDDGNRLRFQAEIERSHATNLMLLRSDYHAPFGTYHGTLPGGWQLSDAYGVMEDHHALW